MNDHLHIPSARLVVEYDGIPFTMMSKALLDQQNCWQNLEEIKEAHWFKYLIFHMIMETNDRAELKSLSLDLQEIEFHLQELWGFPLNANYHRFWDYPKCKCPKKDNQDAYPNYQIINLNCPLHGEI